MTIYLLNSDARNIPLADQSAQCIITSPPYYGLRDYGTAQWDGGDPMCDHIEPKGSTRGGPNSTLSGGQDLSPHNGQFKLICAKCGAIRIDKQIGLERTPQEYVASIVAVMRECWRVLKDDGVLWLNLGDSYAGGGVAGSDKAFNGKQGTNRGSVGMVGKAIIPDGLKPKDLIGIPWRCAFALQDDGWYLRSDIIWSKPNPMPESVTDRPTKAHEYIFLLTKRARYYYDAAAIQEQSIYPDDNRKSRSDIDDKRMPTDVIAGIRPGSAIYPTRNRRSVWTVATTPYSGAKGIADYVGDDGKPYKASPDCPIHGHLARERMSYTVGYDAQLDRNQNRNSGNGNGHEQAPVSLQSAMTSRNSQDGRGENARKQSLESIDDYRSEANLLEYTAPVQTDSRTNHTLEHDEPSDHTSDLKRREYSLSANGHSKRKSKTARAHRTSRHDTASEETNGYKQSMLSIVENIDSDVHTGESNTSEDYASSEIKIDPSVEMSYRNAGIDNPFDTSHMRLYCTCEVVSIDHFATFPPKLIEPMVLAGSRPGDLILDPFAGTATVGRVAIKHQRRFVGLDLNLKYIGDLAKERTSKVQVSMQFATEP